MIVEKTELFEQAEKPSVVKPWMKYFPPDSRGIGFSQKSLYFFLKDVAAASPGSAAIYYYGMSLSYRGLLKKVDETANAFTAAGVKAGDIVSFLTVTLPETVFAMYALNKIGAISNFIDPRMDVQRIEEAIGNAGSAVLVTLDIVWPKVEKALEKLKLEHIVVQNASDSLPLLAKAAYNAKKKDSSKIPFDARVQRWNGFFANGKGHISPEVLFEKDEMAVITYTGGTTGTPKGVMLTNESINAVVQSFTFAGVDYRPENSFLDIMPVFASYGVICGIHLPVAAHVRYVLVPNFKPDRLGYLLRKYKPMIMMGVPAFYEKLMHSREMKGCDLSFLYITGCGGDTMNPTLQQQFNAFLRIHHAPYPLSQGYGMSEVTSAATCCFNDVYKDNSAGIPLLAVTVGIFDPETNEELDIGQEGEICISGPTVMKGYYNDPVETAKIMKRHRDGSVWVHSGDLGYMDEDGFIFIKGRIKQIIIRFDGHKVFPVTIESVVRKHEKVRACAVVGVQDPDHMQGMTPLAVVATNEAIDSPSERASLRRELLELCDRLCEERGRPSDVTFIDEIPLTSMGKNDYKLIQRMYEGFEIVKTR